MSSVTEQKVRCDSVAATGELGKRLGRCCLGGELIALIGELGAGKTQLVKGIAAGCETEDPAAVNSPTFVIHQQYQGHLIVNHFDAYRLNGHDDLVALGFEEVLEMDRAITVLEWADRVAAVLPADRLTVEIEICGTHQRLFSFRSGGSVSANLLASFGQ